jgi:hypothetical protein
LFIRLSIFTAVLLTGVILCIAVPSEVEQARPGLDDLAWLAGHWQGGSNGRVTEELWLPPAGGLMLGLNRVVGPEGKAFFEYLRIEQTAEGVFYRATPRGGATTSFKLVQSSSTTVVFENRAHDFPQRISYAMTPTDELLVTISGDVDRKTESRSWSWRRISEVARISGGESR